MCAVRDPDPRVNGGGIAKLRDAGVAVTVGAFTNEAEQLMSGFFHRLRHGVPEVIALDGSSPTLPTEIDALLVSLKGRPRLRGWTGDIDVCGVEPHRLLTRMGELGLDPVFTALSSSAGVPADTLPTMSTEDSCTALGSETTSPPQESL